MKRLAGWVSLCLAAIGIVSIAFPGIASAHTDAEATAAEAGLTSITFIPEQECGAGSDPTIGLRVQLPEGATEVRPLADPGWTADATASEVSWRVLPSAEATSTTFTVEMVLSQPAGSTVYLPTIQQCPDGEEIVWLQMPTVLERPSKRPAPSIVVPANATVPATAPSSIMTGSEPATTPDTTAAPAPSRDNGGLPWVALVMFVVAIVIVLGAMVLVLRLRRSDPEP